ncbi:hypothetical protein Psta_4302 [Pirellula staleyi DSM 6068]|uniref:Uncharacterized protein n=1 Tax=Pirellula staleyi (strain ATCC 27377 / DSM 6068 / ICPB 4128) TaxID=530564 RepID=D2R4Y8_PIRSD|nr:hypothetical protein [Pirellula staleyi]ADB18950.1 hypothetical protein Psta_4302 [Pirellula staleyi DSM 6068]
MKRILCSFLVLAIALLATAVPASAQEAKPDPELAKVQIIGALTKFYPYQTFLMTGMLADAYQKEVYDAATVQQFLVEIDSMLNDTTKRIELVRSGFTDDADREYFDKVVDICDLLKKQAKGLSDYTKTKAQSDLNRYSKAREQVWPMLQDILGIKKNDGDEPAAPAPPAPADSGDDDEVAPAPPTVALKK